MFYIIWPDSVIIRDCQVRWSKSTQIELKFRKNKDNDSKQQHLHFIDNFYRFYFIYFVEVSNSLFPIQTLILRLGHLWYGWKNRLFTEVSLTKRNSRLYLLHPRRPWAWKLSSRLFSRPNDRHWVSEDVSSLALTGYKRFRGEWVNRWHRSK